MPVLVDVTPHHDGGGKGNDAVMAPPPVRQVHLVAVGLG